VFGTRTRERYYENVTTSIKLDIREALADARAGKNPSAICRVPSGWVLMGKYQMIRGYCLLFADPIVPSLNDLDEAGRKQFLYDMSIVGDALLAVTGAKRINYEILGNKEPVLHAHLFPRYPDEQPVEMRQKPVWQFVERKEPFDLTKHKPLMEELAREITKRLNK